MTQFSPEVIKSAEEFKKCAKSYDYFVDNYCFIQDRKTGSAIPFKLWEGQKTAARKVLTAQYLIVLKARQLGLTWLIASYCLWRGMFHFQELIVVISAKEDLAIEFLDRIKFMFDRLPDWMKPSVYKRTTTELTFAIEQKDDKGNVKLGGLNSSIKSIPSTPDAGQSKTVSLLVMDESALNRYCREIWSAAKPTLEHANGKAIILSNPSKDKPGWGWTRDIYTGSMKGLNVFDRIFLDPFCVPGRGAGFIEQQKKDGLSDDDIIMQYPQTEEEAISILGGSYFGNVLAKYTPWSGVKGRIEVKDKALVFTEDDKGILEVWSHPEKNWKNRYSIGSDIAEGLGGTNTSSVAYVYDRKESCFVARLRSSMVEADVWAGMLVMLGKYYNDATVGAERNGAGITAIIALKRLNYPYLYYRQKQGDMKGQYSYEYGWPETNENKQILVDELKKYFREVFSSVPCAFLLDECSTFIRHDNGKIAHEDGKYDDCVIAAGITLQVSISMPTLEDTGIKPRPSMYDRRIEQLERVVTGPWEEEVIRNIREMNREMGLDDVDADYLIEDRGSKDPVETRW